MSDPTVSQKLARLMKCSYPSLPLGKRDSKSARLIPSLSSVRQNLLAFMIGSEKKICISDSSVLPSRGEGWTARGIAPPLRAI